MKEIIKDIKNFQEQFYSVKRLNINLENFTGPFGFDIYKAYDFCSIIDNNDIDTIIETGTNIGDTSEFLALRYPDKKIITCEINPTYFEIAKMRLKEYKNVNIFLASSDFVIKNINQNEHNIIYFLDAHFDQYWPLKEEINNIERGFVMIDDFDIKCPNYYYGNGVANMVSKENIKCDIDTVKNFGKLHDVYVNNVFFDYKIPNHQMDLRAGRCFYQKKFTSDIFLNENFKKVL